MLSGYRIVPFIPAGRQRVMSILLNNLRRFPEIDEVQVWLNTADQPNDDTWLATLPFVWDKIKLYRLPDGQPEKRPKQLNTGKFYVYTMDEDTLYFRFDDDIVYVDDNYFRNMAAARLNNPKPPIVCGNIWNNAVCSYLHQQQGHIDTSHGVVQSAYCMDMVGWQSGPFAEYIHEVMLERISAGLADDLYLDGNYVLENTRFSISNFCFTGKAMRQMIPKIDDEEIWLTEEYPAQTATSNIICGDALTSHYSFFAQRPHLDQTDILAQYRKRSERLLSEKYYDLLGQANG
jgi:hypothetical protein